VNLEPETANPYVGLRPFEQEDSLYFFGRREQTAALLERLHRSRFLAVVGSSGCGKSSLIRAGLIPSLLGGFLVEERDAWQIAIMKPGDAPLHNLAAALCQALEKAPNDASIASLHKALVADHTQAVVLYVRPRLGANTNLLLLIDQFEETFHFRGAEEEAPTPQPSRQQRLLRAQRHAEADDFVDLVLGLRAETHLAVYTVLTMRTDFLGDCDLFYGLPEAMNESRYLVPRLSRQQLRQAIEGPALLARASIAPRLLDRLLNQLGDRADRLPVLQHALMRTWNIWRHEGQTDGPLDLAHYADAGTLQNALSQHADEALRPSDLDTTAKVFKCLTATDAHHRRVRRPARLSELVAVADETPDVIRAILDRFCEDDRNFLAMSASDDPDDPLVDISHESLIRQWDALKGWVDEERESRDQLLHLVGGGRGYRRGERALLQDPELQMALNWWATDRPTAAWAKRYSTRDNDFDVAMHYLEQSSEARDKAKTWRFRLYGISGFAIFLLLLSPFAYDGYRNLFSRYYYFSEKESISANIEIYRGLPGSWDLLNLQRYIADSDTQRLQLEPSRRFGKEVIDHRSHIDLGLIEYLEPVEKIKEYWESGQTGKAYSEIENYLKVYPERNRDIVGIIPGFRSLETVKKLKEYLLDKNMKNMHESVLDMMIMLPIPLIMETLLDEISSEDDKYPDKVRHAMVEALARIRYANFDIEHADKIKSTLTFLARRPSRGDDEPGVNVAAVQVLMRLDSPEAVNQLISLSDSRLSREAIDALAGSQDDRVAEFLSRKQDETNNPYLKRRLVEAFAQMGGSDVVKTLSETLIEDESVRIRQSAVRALGQTGMPDAVEPLLRRLKENMKAKGEVEEDEREVRQSIIEALGRLGHHHEAVQFLLENVLLADNNSFDAGNMMARATVEAIGQIGNAETYEMLIDKLQGRNIYNDNHYYEEMIDESLSRGKLGRIVDLISRLGDQRATNHLGNLLSNNGSNNDALSQSAADALARLGEGAVAVGPLTDLLNTAKDRKRLDVVSALGRLGSLKARSHLRQLVDRQGGDRQDIIYLGALAALGQLRDARVLGDLTTWLQQGDSLTRRGNLETLVGSRMAGRIERQIASETGAEGDVRQAAVEVLGEYGSIRPVDLLLARLSDGSIFVRRGAARALGRLGKHDIRIVERLLFHLHDSDSGVRQHAAEALGSLGDRRAVTSLVASLQDSDGNVRREVAKALGRLGDARALEPLLSRLRGAKGKRPDGVEDVRRAALLAAAQIGLTSHSERIACEVRAVFDNEPCHLGGSEQTISEHERVRLAAAVGLLALPPQTATNAAVEAWLEKYVDGSQAISRRKELAEMLGDFPSRKGLELLLKLLEDTNLNVQESALKAFGQASAGEPLTESEFNFFYERLQSPNFRLQKAAAEALAEIASAHSIDKLAAMVSATDSIPTRLASLKALYHIAAKGPEDHQVRKTVIGKMLAAIESPEGEATLSIQIYNLLGDLKAAQALSALQARLTAQVDHLDEWRRNREKPADQTTSGRDDPLEKAQLARHLAFELAYNIARIDPRTSGLSLLGDDLAEIRQGAWKGLGSVGDVALVAELHERLKDGGRSWLAKLWNNEHPFFRHAVYQAIHHILLRLEAEGVESKELDRLEQLTLERSGTPCEPPGSPEAQVICARVKWTFDQIKLYKLL
jgi:HEAT repeat protein